MAKYRVTLVKMEKQVGAETVDFHHGTVADTNLESTFDLEVEASDPASAIAEAEKISQGRARGEPALVV